MSRCLAALGAFDGAGDGWIVELDAERGTIDEVAHISPPAGLAVPGKGLTGLAWLPDGRLAVSAAAGVFLLHGGRVQQTWAMPSFNDLHGLAHYRDRVYLVNTGLDAIDVVDLDGRFQGQFGFDPLWLTAQRQAGRFPDRAEWARLLDTRWSGRGSRFEPRTLDGGYYGSDGPWPTRKVPDRVHPNAVTRVDGGLWVTSLALCAVVDVMDWRLVARFDAPPHDGQATEDALWATRIDGVVEARHLAEPEQVIRRLDVSALSGVHGWCRGLHLDARCIWVGFTAIRRRPRYPWDRAPYSSTRTAVVCLDRASGEVRRVFELAIGGRHLKVGGLGPVR